ncbi:MAG: TonB-dependent receptor [Parasphingopyxis sp.]|uniref:TonB-dependent receptor n=1 Tax=Parasphingopyxis sp. TaxID=1920299 RepID=UPI003FA162CD
MAAPAFAQNEGANDIDPDLLNDPNVIIVTGRAGAGELLRNEASYAITTLDEERLRLENPLSVADIFRSVPGFWVEASGGEASNNIRVRGIPRDGYSAIGLYEDGLPVQHDPGLGFLNADQSFRFDETYERVEAVRGGPSSIFASNAPGGLVNFIPRRGGDEFEGLFRAQIGDYDLYRGDAWIGGPLGPDIGFSFGGFYRIDDGIRDTQFRANEGGQIRANISGEVGPGRFFVDVKHLNDSVTFFLPVPLTFDADGDTAEVPGFDAQFGTYAGRPTDDLTFRNVGGDFLFDLSRGTDIELTQITARLELELGGGFEIQNGFRYRTSDTVRNGLFPATIVSGADRLDGVRAQLLATVPGAVDVQLRYADTGELFDPVGQNGSGLTSDAVLSSVEIPIDEITNDVRIAGQFEAGGMHDIAIGFYFSTFDVGFRRFGSIALLEVADNARLLDVVAVDADGNPLFIATENGISRYGSQFNNAENTSEVIAFYASDEWSITDELRLDFGIRWEQLQFQGFVGETTSVDLGVPTTIADDQVLTGTGTANFFDRTFDDFGFTVGANWQFNPDFGIFGRYTQTFRLPNATDFLGSATRTDLVKEEIQLAELGIKYSAPFADLYLTGFYTYFEGVRFNENVFDPATGDFIQRTEFADTETWGIEAEGVIRPVEFFDLTFNATYQNPEFRNFDFTAVVDGDPVPTSFSGNQLLRVPEFSFRVIPGLNLLDGRVRIQGVIEYYGDRFADAANEVKLPAYTVLSASARFDVTDNFSLYVYGDNLTNKIGLTEGNPRAGQFISGDAGAEFYLARPILGRSFRAAALVRF